MCVSYLHSLLYVSIAANAMQCYINCLQFLYESELTIQTFSGKFSILS